MCNEMGNQNSNGLKVSEKESEEVIDQLDGLKGMTEYLEENLQNLKVDFDESADVENTEHPEEECDTVITSTVSEETERRETFKNVADGTSEVPIVADGTFKVPITSDENDDQTHLISLGEHQDSPDDICTEPSNVMIQDQKFDNDEKENKDLVKEDTRLVDFEKSVDIESIESSQEHGKVIQSTEETSKEVANSTSEALIISDEKEDQTHLITSGEHQDSPDDICNEPCNAIIHDQKFDIAGSEKDSDNQDSEEITVSKPLEGPVDHDNEEVQPHLILSTEIALNENFTDSSQNQCDSDENPVQKESSQQGENVEAMTVAQGTNGKDDKSEDKMIQTQDSINMAHLEALDSKISKLLENQDPEELNSEANFDKETTPEEENRMDDMERDDLDIELNNIDTREEEENGEDDVSEAVFEFSIQHYEEDPVVKTNSTIIQETESEKNEVSKETVSDATVSDTFLTQDIVADTLDDEALANKEDLFAIDIIQEARTYIPYISPEIEEKNEQAMPVNKVDELILTDSAWCIPTFDTKASEGCTSNFNEDSDISVVESVKCVTYEFENNSYKAEENTVSYDNRLEAITEERKPQFRHEKCKSITDLEVPGTDKNIREYRVSTSHEDINKMSDMSPLLSHRKSEELRASTDGTDDEKPRTPFFNFLKQEASLTDSVEKEGLIEKKTQPPSKKSSSSSREKQKTRSSSFFGSCICCTPVTN